MSFTPTSIVTPATEYLRDLEFPRDRVVLMFLSLDQKQAWYAAQKPEDLIFESQEFIQFWHSWYIEPLKWKRWFYGLFW